MRYDRNFNPEWGYVAPAPSVMRTARLIAARGDHRRDRRRGDGVFVAGSAGSGSVGCSAHVGDARPQAASDNEHVGRGAAAD